MAEILGGAIVAEVIKTLFKGIKSRVLELYIDQTGVQKKIVHLEMLIMAISSTVEVSMRYNIETNTLLQWQERLRQAMIEGQIVLSKFNRDGNIGSSLSKDNGSSSSSSKGDGSASSSSSSPSESQNSPLFGKKELDELAGIIEKLEATSQTLHIFVKLVKLEYSPVKQLSQKNKSPPGPNNEVEERPARKKIRRLLDISTIFHLHSQSYLESRADCIEELVAKIKLAIEDAEKRCIDGLCLGQWMAELNGAAEEGECVVSAIKSLDYNDPVYTDEVLRHISVVLIGVYWRFKMIIKDVNHFLQLVELERMAIDFSYSAFCLCSLCVCENGFL